MFRVFFCSVFSNYIRYFRSSQRRYSIKKAIIYRKTNVLESVLIKRNSITDVFQWLLRNFWKYLFWRTSANGCFWHLQSKSPCLVRKQSNKDQKQLLQRTCFMQWTFIKHLQSFQSLKWQILGLSFSF